MSNKLAVAMDGIKAIVAISTLAMSAIAQAESPWSGRFSLGSATVEGTSFPHGTDFRFLDAESSGFGMSLGLGYRFSRFFAVELAYADYGDHDLEFTCPQDIVCTNRRIEVDPTAFRGAMLVGWPMGDRFAADLMLGFANTDGLTNDDTELETGIQGRYRLNDTLSLDLRYTTLGAIFSDISSLELGFRVSF